MTGSTRFTPEASLAIGGPDWLVDRRRRAAEQLGALEWPTAAEEIWRYSRIGDLDVDRYRPMDEAELGTVGVENAARRWRGRGRGGLAVRAGRRARRPRGPPRARRLPRGEGRRRLRPRDLRGRGRRPLARAVLRRVARRLHHAPRRLPGRWRVHPRAGGRRGRAADRRPPLVRGRWGGVVPAHARRGRGAERGHGARPVRLAGRRPLRRRRGRAGDRRCRAREVPLGPGARAADVVDRAPARPPGP